jgi:hypothetical protein
LEEQPAKLTATTRMFKVKEALKNSTFYKKDLQFYLIDNSQEK